MACKQHLHKGSLADLAEDAAQHVSVQLLGIRGIDTQQALEPSQLGFLIICRTRQQRC